MVIVLQLSKLGKKIELSFSYLRLICQKFQQFKNYLELRLFGLCYKYFDILFGRVWFSLDYSFNSFQFCASYEQESLVFAIKERFSFKKKHNIQDTYHLMMVPYLQRILSQLHCCFQSIVSCSYYNEFSVDNIKIMFYIY